MNPIIFTTPPPLGVWDCILFLRFMAQKSFWKRNNSVKKTGKYLVQGKNEETKSLVIMFTFYDNGNEFIQKHNI